MKKVKKYLCSYNMLYIYIGMYIYLNSEYKLFSIISSKSRTGLYIHTYIYTPTIILFLRSKRLKEKKIYTYLIFFNFCFFFLFYTYHK